MSWPLDRTKPRTGADDGHHHFRYRSDSSVWWWWHLCGTPVPLLRGWPQSRAGDRPSVPVVQRALITALLLPGASKEAGYSLGFSSVFGSSSFFVSSLDVGPIPIASRIAMFRRFRASSRALP